MPLKSLKRDKLQSCFFRYKRFVIFGRWLPAQHYIISFMALFQLRNAGKIHFSLGKTFGGISFDKLVEELIRAADEFESISRRH